jgi:hypothetical protein
MTNTTVPPSARITFSSASPAIGTLSRLGPTVAPSPSPMALVIAVETSVDLEDLNTRSCVFAVAVFHTAP